MRLHLHRHDIVEHTLLLMPPALTPAYKHVPGFAKAGVVVFALEHIAIADFSDIENLRVHVTLTTGERILVEDIDAMELGMLIKPSVLENRRLRWPRWSWVVHNVFGHPILQVLALFKLYKWAFWVHDATVPRPVGKKQLPQLEKSTDA